MGEGKMEYAIIIVFKERNKPDGNIDPFLSMKFIAGNLVIYNGYHDYDFPIEEISHIKFEKVG
jgi:hypothetical protein